MKCHAATLIQTGRSLLCEKVHPMNQFHAEFVDVDLSWFETAHGAQVHLFLVSSQPLAKDLSLVSYCTGHQS